VSHDAPHGSTGAAGRACPVCRSVSARRQIELRGTSAWAVACNDAKRYTMYECAACGSSFAMPREPAPADHYVEEGEYYGWRWEFDRCLSDLEAYVDGGTLLEIGCGEGSFLARLPARFSPLGVDLNPKAVATARFRGLRAIVGEIGEVQERIEPGSVAAAAMFHVLEHMAEPLDAASAVAQLLGEGGWLFLSVPNPDRAAAELVREAWDQPPHHLTRFTRRGLVTLLDAAGFAEVRCESEPATINPFRLALTAATVRLAGRRPASLQFSKPRRAALKLGPFLLALPRAWRACRRRHGTALYVVARRRAAARPA
jgi:SAM-dependent methyltransferase